MEQGPSRPKNLTYVYTEMSPLNPLCSYEIPIKTFFKLKDQLLRNSLLYCLSEFPYFLRLIYQRAKMYVVDASLKQLKQRQCLGYDLLPEKKCLWEYNKNNLINTHKI
jgi:hypothetical protein